MDAGIVVDVSMAAVIWLMLYKDNGKKKRKKKKTKFNQKNIY